MMRKMIVAVLVWLLPVAAVAAETEPLGRLLVITSPYCPYCQAFMHDVAPAYPKTEVGGLLPMVEVNNVDPPEAYEEWAWEIRFVPTFLVLDLEGREQARIRGYRGDEFFWSDLEMVVARMRARMIKVGKQ